MAKMHSPSQNIFDLVSIGICKNFHLFEGVIIFLLIFFNSRYSSIFIVVMFVCNYR